MKYIKEIIILLKAIFLGFILTIKEIAKITKLFVIGLFLSFDFLFDILFKIIDYISEGSYIVVKFIINLLSLFYKYFLIHIAIAIISVSKYCVYGFYFVFKIIFILFPKLIFKYISKFINFVADKLKDQFIFIKQFFQELPGKIKKYFSVKINNMTIVKYYQNKKYENLEILNIDKNSLDVERSKIKKTFRYVAKNQEGKYVTGYFSAFSRLDCYSYLLDEKYEVYKIETNKLINFLHGDNTFFQRKMKTKDLIFWLTQLSTYIKSGVPLTDSVKILSQQDKRKKYKKTYDSLIYELTMGETFSNSLEKQANMFPGLLINMIKAAEMVGDIETTLDEMANYYNEIEKNKKQIISAMTYPGIIFTFSIAIISFILIYVIPKFVDVYSQAGVTMNPFTLTILNLSDFLISNYFLIFILIIAIIVIFSVLYKNVKAFRTTMQYFFMHLPVVGKIIIYNEMTLFSKTFAQLQDNNVLLTESIGILSKITKNEIYKMLMSETINNLIKGEKMSDSFKNNWAVPELAFYMILTGEKTGDLANMLDKISEFYQGQQKTIINTLKSFIEPIMIAVLAVIVGGIILAVIIPMFGLYTSLT